MYYDEDEDYFDDDSFLDELLEDFDEEDEDDFEDEYNDFEPYRDRNGDLVESEEQERLMEQFGVDTIMDLEDAMDTYQVED